MGRWIAAALLLGLGWSAAAGEAKDDGSTLYRPVDRLNAGLPPLRRPPDLATPYGALANFDDAAGRGDFARAAHSLNLNAFAPEDQAEVGRQLARDLKRVMDQQVWFNWADVPDRPDGADDRERSLEDTYGKSPGPRGNIRLYSLDVGDRTYEIRLERVRPAAGEPVWVVSRQTVERIPSLAEAFAPNQLEARIPDWLKRYSIAKVALWQWIGFAVILLAGCGFAWLVHRGLKFALSRTDNRWLALFAEAVRGPGAVAAGLWTFDYLTRTYLGLAGPILRALQPVLTILIVAGVVWFFQRLIHLATRLVCRSLECRAGDAGANAVLTRVVVARHVLTVLIVVCGGLYALSQFEWFRQVGTTILASAGVAGLLLGIAGQRVLGNLFAGVVLAVTQPVRTGDAILFEGDFGWVEEIALTYIVIRLWDLRRIVVPTSHLMDRPFQNWSRNSQQLMMPVYIYADYRVDVAAVRDELARIMEATDDWDRAVPPILQVTGFRDQTVELRALCSAGDPGTSWSLQCYVRERLLAFLQRYDGGRFLPRTRILLTDGQADETSGLLVTGSARNGH